MNDDLDILTTRYFDGSASSAEIDALENALQADPAAVGVLLACSAEELALHDALSPASEARTAEPLRGSATQLPPHVHLAAARRSRLRTYWIASAAAVALIGIGLTWYLATRSDPRGDLPPQVAESSAEPLATLDRDETAGVAVEHAGAAPAAASRSSISARDRLRTSATAGASFHFRNESSIVVLGPSSVVVLAGTPAAKRIVLEQGNVTCRIEHQKPGESLTVVTDHAQVLVVGTSFKVTAAGTVTRVEVESGTVRVTRLRDSATVDVSGGEFVDAGGKSASPSTVSPQTLSTPRGRDMADFWSTKVRPAGIDQ